MDIGSIAICITIGALIVFASIVIGVCFGRNDNRDNQRQSDNDSDVRTYIPVRDRNRGRDNSRDISLDEKIMVLRNVRRLTHGREREVMDAIEDMIKERASRDVNT